MVMKEAAAFRWEGNILADNRVLEKNPNFILRKTLSFEMGVTLDIYNP